MKLVAAALSVSTEMVSISGKETGTRVERGGDNSVQAVTIDHLLSQLPGGRVSILQLDMEGSERELFTNNPEKWLSRVDRIIVETHGSESASAVLNALKNNKWRYWRYRNLYYCYPSEKAYETDPAKS